MADVKMNHKYMNLNGHPIGLPGKTGSIVQFDSGEGSDDPWFGRFVGKGKLTFVQEVQDQQRAALFGGIRNRQPVLPHKTDMIDNLKIIIEEDTPSYKKVNGIYYCKLCQQFRCGGSELILAHLANVHGILPDTKADETVEDTDGSADTLTDVSAEGIGEGSATPPAATGEPPAKTFPCPICGTTFKTNGGLATHTRFKHEVGEQPT
jgi:hypothetical protein